MNRCSRNLAGLLLFLLLLAVAHSPAQAQHCRVRMRWDVAFGTYDPLQSGNLDATGMLQVRCSPSAPNVSVKLDAGTSGSYQPRYMQSGSDRLGYNLYLDASRTAIWGDGTSGTDYLFLNHLDRWLSVTIYGRTPLGQNVPPGSYSDTVVVTVDW